MPVARLVVALLPKPGATIRVPGAELAHARARRLRPGDRVVFVDGSGREAGARVTSVRGRAVEAVVEEVRAVGAPHSPIALFVAGLRMERLSWIVEKATELDVSRVSIVQTGRTQPFRGAAAAERLARVAAEAAKQCGNARWPNVEGPALLADVLAAEQAQHRFLLDPGGQRFPGEISPGATALLVGPEGGFTEEERRAADEHGWRAASLPAGRLRAETAALAGLVLVRAALERGAAPPTGPESAAGGTGLEVGGSLQPSGGTT